MGLSGLSRQVYLAKPAIYSYDAIQKRAVRTAGSYSYDYDANGNMTSRNGSSISYTSYNLPAVINAGAGSSSTLSYGAFRNRYKQVAVTPSTGTETTLYVAGLWEKVTRGGLIEYRHTIHGGKGTAAIHTRRAGSQTNSDTIYVHRDHLGSPELITDSSGLEIVRPSFGAYGERRDGTDWDGPPSAQDLIDIGNTSRRGFTGHEHLDAVGLIHMNGRVYEPIAGRFLGVDPIVQLGNSQSPNSFAYVWNNPLTYTDPSGLTTDRGPIIIQCIDGCGGFWSGSGDDWAPRIYEPPPPWGPHAPPPTGQLGEPQKVSWDGKSFGGSGVQSGAGSTVGGMGVPYGVDAITRDQRNAAFHALENVEAILRMLKSLYPDRGDGLHHYYDFDTPLCRASDSWCDQQRAIDTEFRQPVPPPGKELRIGVWQVRAGISDRKSVSVGNVDVVFWRRLGAHVNLTWDNFIDEPGGHVLQRGAVFRHVYWQGDTLMLRTVGIGNNLTRNLANFNQEFGELVFEFHSRWVAWQLFWGAQ